MGDDNINVSHLYRAYTVKAEIFKVITNPSYTLNTLKKINIHFTSYGLQYYGFILVFLGYINFPMKHFYYFFPNLTLIC